MKILIVGSKGFIGSHAVAYFKQAHEVWECDVVTDYANKNYFLIDATNAHFESIFKKHNFNACINCSGAASVPDSIANPQSDFEKNVGLVSKLLQAIKLYQPSCKFINLSSAAVYGNPEVLPVTVNQTLNPISPYGYHKKMAEELCELYYSQFKIPTASLRIFSAYGPGLQKQLFWDLYKKHTSKKPIVLYGTGQESRDFIFIDDVIQAIALVLEKASFKNTILNVANGEEVTIERAVSTFYKDIDAAIQFTFGGEERKGDPNNWVANITPLKDLGYRKTISLSDGLKKYIVWAKQLG